MAFTNDIPITSNYVASDVPAILSNFSFLATALKNVFTGWDNNDPTTLVLPLDTISEKTATAGVTVDGCLFKDGVRKGWAIKIGVESLSSTGNHAVTGVGFTPKAVILMAPKSGAAGLSVGYITSTVQGVVVTYYYAVGAATTTHSATECIVTGQLFVQFESMDADGFTLSVLTCVGTHDFYYLAIG